MPSSDSDASREREIVLHLLDVARWRQPITQLLRGETVGSYQLPKNVLSRCATFLRQEDAERCAAGEILRVIALLAYGGARLAQSPVERDRYGKPFLVSSPDVEFNLSHSGNLVLCAADRFPLGVDVEQIGPVDHSLIRACFTSVEQGRLDPLTSSDASSEASSGFHRLWTMKESLLKGIGLGLQIDPVDIEIAPIDAEGKSWHCVALRGEGKHLARDLEQRFVVSPVAVPSGYAAAVAAIGSATIRTVVDDDIGLLERSSLNSFYATSDL